LAIALLWLLFLISVPLSFFLLLMTWLDSRANRRAANSFNARFPRDTAARAEALAKLQAMSATCEPAAALRKKVEPSIPVSTSDSPRPEPDEGLAPPIVSDTRILVEPGEMSSSCTNLPPEPPLPVLPLEPFIQTADPASAPPHPGNPVVPIGAEAVAGAMK